MSGHDKTARPSARDKEKDKEERERAGSDGKNLDMNEMPLTKEELAAAKSTHYERVRVRGQELVATIERILPPSREFVCEIGCGHGHFLTAYAQARPERVCVGLDLVSDRIARANKKRERARLGHLHFIRADARLFMEVLPPAARIADLYILFPDPWPKLRHHKHRIIQSELLEVAAGKMAPGARMFFRTDYEPYFADARETIAGHPRWRVVEEPWDFEFETVFQSRAEGFYSLVARVR
jgi:tRNA (guanine-N7-)-methyltransferase